MFLLVYVKINRHGSKKKGTKKNQTGGDQWSKLSPRFSEMDMTDRTTVVLTLSLVNGKL